MNTTTKVLEEIKTKHVGDAEEIITVHLLREFHERINQSQLTVFTNIIVKPKIPHKLTFISACTAVLKIKLGDTSDEDEYLEITSSLVALVNSILDFLVSRSCCSTFNAQDRYFSKTVESVATLFISLRKKSAHFGFVFMKTCSPQILTLITCKRLEFSLRKILAILYAEEVSHCDLKIFKRITQSQPNLLNELVLWLPLCGDFQLQEALTEIAIYNSASVGTPDKTDLIKKWLANQVYASAIDSLLFEKFSTSLRTCLNSINSATKPKKVYTLACLLCVGDNNTPLNKPQDVDYTDLWVDFNTSSSSIHLIHSPDLAGLEWKRIVLPLSDVKNIEVSPSKCLIKKWPNSAQLHLTLKYGLNVMTLGRLYEFTFMIFHFHNDDNFKQLIDEFLCPNFPQLINSKMNSFKKPGAESLKDAKQNSSRLFNLGAKAYFSQKSSNLSTSDISKNSSSNFIADNNSFLKKYLNISKENRLKNDKKSSYCDASHDSINYHVGSSLDESNLVTSLTRPSSTTFVSVLAHKKKCLNSDLTPRKLQGEGWTLKSKPSAFPCREDDNQLFMRQAGGGKLKNFNTDNNNNVYLSDKENVEKGLGEILSKPVGEEKLDVSIFPDPDSDDDDYLPNDILRSSNVPSPTITEVFPAFLAKNDENKTTKLPLPSLLDDDSNGSNDSILGLSRLSFSAVQKLPKELGEVPLPEFDSDNSSSIIPGSQVTTPPKIPESSKQIYVNKQPNKPIETNISKRADKMPDIGDIKKAGEITEADSVSISSSPDSIKSDDFFVTNRNKSITNFYDNCNVKDIKPNEPASNQDLTSQVPCVNNEKSCFLRADKFLSKFLTQDQAQIEIEDSARNSYCKEYPLSKSSRLTLSENSAFTCVSNLPKQTTKDNIQVSFPDNIVCVQPFKECQVELFDIIKDKQLSEEAPFLADPKSASRRVRQTNSLEVDKLHFKNHISIPKIDSKSEVLKPDIIKDLSKSKSKSIPKSVHEAFQKDKFKDGKEIELKTHKSQVLQPQSVSLSSKELNTNEKMSSDKKLEEDPILVSKSKNFSQKSLRVENLTKVLNEGSSISSVGNKSHSKSVVEIDSKTTVKTKESAKLSNSPAVLVKRVDSSDSNFIANPSRSEDSQNLSTLPLKRKDNIHLQESLLKYSPAAFNLKEVANLPGKSADLGKTMFRPISRNEPSPFSFLPRHEPSFRSTDASSKMELELIMNQQGDGLKEKNNIHQTPFKRSHSKAFVEKPVEIVKESSSRLNCKLLNKPIESQTTIGEITSRAMANQVINQCSPAKSSVLMNNTNQTVISSSDSSFLLTPQGSKGSSQNLNFTRIINTDANNNTLEGKKNFLKASPSTISVYKPIKTYTRKPAEKLNYRWFTSSGVNKKKSDSISVNQPIKKKKLFHLPTNYTESHSEFYRVSNPSVSSFLTNQLPSSSRSRNKNVKAKEVSTTLFDITELNESSGEEFTIANKKRNNFKKNRRDSCISDTVPSKFVRRSSRTQKNVNYKEESEPDTDKSAPLKETISDHNSKKTLENQIKNVILNSVSNSNEDKMLSSEKSDFGINRTNRLIEDNHNDVPKSKNLKYLDTNEIDQYMDEKKSGDKWLSDNDHYDYFNTEHNNNRGKNMQDLTSRGKSNAIDVYDFVETSISEKSRSIKKNRRIGKGPMKKLMNKNIYKLPNLDWGVGNNESPLNKRTMETTVKEPVKEEDNLEVIAHKTHFNGNQNEDLVYNDVLMETKISDKASLKRSENHLSEESIKKITSAKLKSKPRISNQSTNDDLKQVKKCAAVSTLVQKRVVPPVLEENLDLKHQNSRNIVESDLVEVTSFEPTTSESLKDASVCKYSSSPTMMTKLQVHAMVHHNYNFEPNLSKRISTDLNPIHSKPAPTDCSSNLGILGPEEPNLDKNMLSLLDSVSNTVEKIQDSLNNQKHLLSSLKEIIIIKDTYSQQQQSTT